MGQKIVITANMKNKTQRIARKDVVYQWHWRRISMVAGVALVASSGLWYVTSTPAIAEQASTAQRVVNIEQPTSLDTQVTHDASEIAATSVEHPLPSDKGTVLALHSQTNEEVIEPVIAAQQSTVSDAEAIGADTKTEVEGESALLDVTEEPTVVTSLKVADSQQQDGMVVDEKSLTDNSSEFDQEAKVANLAQGSKIDTDKVSRAVLTTHVEDREPVSSLGREISMGDFDSQLVFFTELRGLQGQKVHHIWYYEGQALANVELGVYTARYRTFSSKNIMPSQAGLWRVELRDSNNKLLATREFRLIAKP